MTATYQPYRLDAGSNAEPDLALRVHELELRARALEASIHQRFAQLKAEIQTKIWEDRLKGLFVISVSLAVVMWVTLIASWLR